MSSRELNFELTKLKTVLLLSFIITIMSFNLFAASQYSNEDFQALIVSSNSSFVPTEKDLSFASLDADRLSQALITSAHVPEHKIQNLKDPSIKKLDEVIELLSKNKTQKFMFYFSGHSDENGLHLKDGSITKTKFHELLAKVQSKIKIVILDSCFSGAFRTKGVKKDRPIELVQYNVDEPTGSVMLTSSSSREFSYEHDRLNGSIFTYHLITGLYGQADSNTDGLITIDELYQYVYSQTKFQSMVSGGKIQSPEFETKLSGQGALVVAYPNRINGDLKLTSTIEGELTLISAKGINFFKFYKNKGESKVISLPKGKYNITLTSLQNVGNGQIEIIERQSQTLDSGSLNWEARDIPPARAKGATSRFLFGLTTSTHPPFYETEKSGGMTEFFILSPATETGWGRWRLGAHLGGQSHLLKATQEKVQYDRTSIGAQGNFKGHAGWNNEWLFGYRFGTIISNNHTNTPSGASISHLYFGSRFFPENEIFYWDFLFGIDTIKVGIEKSKGVSTLGVALSF
jgi:hypothetical protein